MSTLLIFGSRHFDDRAFAYERLDRAAARLRQKGMPIEHVISGTARGADTIGEQWAAARGIAVLRYPADWDLHGRKAGMIRNQQMLVEGKPTHAVGFIFENSRGSADMARRLKGAGVPLWEIWPAGEARRGRSLKEASMFCMRDAGGETMSAEAYLDACLADFLIDDDGYALCIRDGKAGGIPLLPSVVVNTGTPDGVDRVVWIGR